MRESMTVRIEGRFYRAQRRRDGRWDILNYGQIVRTITAAEALEGRRAYDIEMERCRREGD